MFYGLSISVIKTAPNLPSPPLFPSLGLPSDFMCQSAEVAEEVGERVRRAGAGVDTLVDSLGSKIRGQQEEQEGLDRRLRREARAMDWKSFQR